ncbi:transglycosylase SLT domain-containing protein [Flavobacterium sp.]|uniref:transglycosylase SLT domain-containing protein n=1 Tax=Flavobacterium sp. TaxID=239 RepID=UPI002B4AF758|nr:transglycosylase SLT domain-containing protein [Flavobacterium sp.]HLF51507.1 transglycosylase SLT domain-containing protein [Flavobacterium sp.]
MNRVRRGGFFTLTDRGETIKQKWGHLTSIASIKWGIPENVIIATIGIESDGNPNLVGNLKEIGLMQLLPETFSDYERRNNVTIFNPFNPANNIDAGSWYLSEVQKNFPLEKWYEKIQAYNVGIAGYRKGRRNPDYINRLRLFVNF